MKKGIHPSSQKTRKKMKAKDRLYKKKKVQKDFYQYRIQVGEFPAMHHYAISPFHFESPRAAWIAGQKYCERNGIRFKDQYMHIRKGREPVKPKVVYHA